MKESPLFNPVLYKGGHITVLDETALPFKETRIKVKNLKTALSLLKEMKTRAFGQVLLFYYTLLLEARKNKINSPEKFSRLSTAITDKFSKARPTFAFGQLNNDLAKMLKAADNSKFIDLLEKSVFTYINLVQGARRYRVKLIAKILPHSARLLTHCNISGELVLLANEAEKMGKSVEFFATETRPYFQGSRLTAWELYQAGLNVYLICDIQAADILKRCRIDMVLVGSDRSTQNGDIANKIGTYQLAVLAKYFHIPFYAFMQPPGDTKNISDIKIEYRPKEEMLKFDGIRIAPKTQEALYPAFDIVPAELISGLVFFDGIYTPQELALKWQK
ncbi:MAG: hypothetical protein COV72_04170 [Candidatus Omnitrophica bacterium CG11_big_fil_rev_8_21_14_0_20_42_13]|uniref:S-methyl-5-thioribose-1-phosphate isomerase n=1 Tax=Candidatus Ghiorseimicrobium undicola TaxID=1974746 RepID=A0A2H0LXQ5_9BACT|nr:MAG: hypothetical protein COV72_04170 [Candidatus Omnitrophica bacterium CG11_big_fil_rev_8_21_14_0_20_42_13]